MYLEMFKILIEYIKALIAEQWKICIANRIPVAVLALSALTSCAAIASVGGQTRLIAYEEQGGWRVEVFDLRAGRLTSGGREILGPAREQSEFSGPIRPCASPDYYCFVTGLHVAVPRAGSPSS